MSKRQFVLLFLINLSGWALGSGLMPLLQLLCHTAGRNARPGRLLSVFFLRDDGCGHARIRLGVRIGRPRQGGTGHLRHTRCAPRLVDGPSYDRLATSGTDGSGAVHPGDGDPRLHTRLRTYAKSHERGKVFGVLQVCGGLGAVIGGLTLGPLADRWGYPTMFAVASGTMLVAALAAFLLEERTPGSDRPEGVEATKRQAGWGVAFSLLFTAGLVAPLAYYVGLMSRSLVMGTLGFGAAAISSTAVAAGIVAIPLPFVIGWLSDRAGRKTILAACYLAIATSLSGALAEATSLWHFRVAMALGATMSTTLAVGSASPWTWFPRSRSPRPSPGSMRRCGLAEPQASLLRAAPSSSWGRRRP